ncbi:MAG: hypothetical protein KDE47_21890, partial [Caldilineaceae bacterium]|nr:hypothetical protein [Caldilineaceae bacterium]
SLLAIPYPAQMLRIFTLQPLPQIHGILTEHSAELMPRFCVKGRARASASSVAAWELRQQYLEVL